MHQPGDDTFPRSWTNEWALAKSGVPRRRPWYAKADQNMIRAQSSRLVRYYRINFTSKTNENNIGHAPSVLYCYLFPTIYGHPTPATSYTQGALDALPPVLSVRFRFAGGLCL